MFAPVLLTGFVLGFSASLNHFHMKISPNKMAQFPESVFLVTQNLSCTGAIATWITGGLNFHIEHHLFPHVPHIQLKKISPYVQEFAKNHNLQYSVNEPTFALRRVIERLQDPSYVLAKETT